jgi:hypothetical protein
MAEAALLIAMLLHRPPGLVATVYDMAGLSGVVVCEYESQFNERAWRREERGGTSWGLWQLWSVCHPQYRDELLMHIVYGAEFWRKCLEKANGAVYPRPVSLSVGTLRSGTVNAAPSIAVAYSIWNSGSPWRSIEKGREVQRRYNSLAMFLWRHLR